MSSSAGTVPHLGRYGHRYLVFAICAMSLLIISVDATAVNVALPSIRADLHSTVSGLQWTIDAYALVLASLLLLSGTTADRLGRRRTFQLGLIVFVVASVLCSLAPSVEWLVAFRILQGIGGSMLNPVAMSIVQTVFREPRERARVVGIWSSVAGLAVAVGPLAGGALTDAFGWRSIFWINAPIGVAALLLAAWFVPESLSGRIHRFDPLGQTLVIALLTGTVGALIEGARLGFGHWLPVLLAAVAVLSLVALLVVEPRRHDPFIDLRFFRSLPFSSSIASAVLAYSANGAFLFLVTLYLQDVRGLTPLAAGVQIVPMAAAQLVFSLLAGRLVAGFGPRVPLGFASIALAAAGFVLAALRVDSPEPLLIVAFALFGAGIGLVNAPVTTGAVAGMPHGRLGTATGLISTSRQVGISLGVALAGAISGLGAQVAVGPTFPAATAPVWFALVGVAVAIAVLTFLAASRFGVRSAERVAHLLDDSEPHEDDAHPVQEADDSDGPDSPDVDGRNGGADTAVRRAG